ncbi:MBL fold metallo-hydrolase [Streptomyces sp. SID5785]|uniref:MBL fold metallo-hydrolase n=1 Tax=Streptomyces sp. SID5785 TaxID=2690309 RepID=UPI0013619263|nr:MBL fold metallo-hydrolase [Streptomyces sp. SID5785]MZD09915.1 MBL fold metallo-hydrolase [Streptomyces sp. SID5785]
MVLGDIEVLRVEEVRGAFGAPGAMFPGIDPVWQEHEEWLTPDFREPADGQVIAAVQAWVLRSGGRTIVVDPGVGNGRERPGTPHFTGLDTDFPDRLRRAGVRPEDVDIVVNTHIHGDHVGWNTREEDGAWVPMFPNADYLIPRPDHDHFGPGGAARTVRDNHRFLFADSIAPVVAAGRAVLWEDSHRIDAHLVLEPAPGHTPGSSVLRLSSGGDRAVFAGDLLHSPAQFLAPTCSSAMCVDPVTSAASRVRVLGRAADEGELVIPAHFPGPGAAEVRREGSAFAVTRWRM